MDQGRVSVSYAKALFDWASKTARIDEVYQQTGTLINLIEDNADFYMLLHSPMISFTKKSESISKVLGSCCPVLTKLVLLMVKNGKENLIRNTLLSFNLLYRKKNQITQTSVESAMPLSQETKQQFIRFFEEKFGGSIEFKHSVNPSLIGGFLITIDDKLVDKSVKGEIETIHRKLVSIEK
ncbi:MAG TPA: ATP synthase F1 subunit delta [Tenuifilaceae bacterium]|nr:ATP synthase F1 subunit delta [Tenuifilaceae bacterium]HPE17077.1 ATP synthase F1 subunit delta [Tenuifilaceae bacterium]HPJ44805.1 ATP synthase F1 subunit delta [Tenuifilaceae bacterium]HPQ32901.1 ATP synthase F1 subunit delta [Tenuifilaceae bacterium]HRX66719.1 ATP synthase F1 subunit delta [Tenuifilaceae bacterium]